METKFYLKNTSKYLSGVVEVANIGRGDEHPALYPVDEALLSLSPLASSVVLTERNLQAANLDLDLEAAAAKPCLPAWFSKQVVRDKERRWRLILWMKFTHYGSGGGGKE